MMRIIKQFFILFITIVWFVVIVPYFLVQTSFGAHFLANFLSEKGQYLIRIENVSHSFGKPYELTLHDISIEDKQSEKILLQAEKLTLALQNDKPLQLHNLEYVLLKNGQVHLDNPQYLSDIPITANLLQLLNITFIYEGEDTISIHNATGGIQPWVPAITNNNLSLRFNFTAEKLSLNQFNVQALVLEGFQKNNTLYFHNIGGNVGSGFFTSKAKYRADHSWAFDEIKINHVNLQTSLSLSELQKIPQTWPVLSVNYLSLIDSSLDTPEIKIEKSNLEVNNIRYQNGWDLQQAKLIFNAESILWQDEIFTSPILQLAMTDSRLNIQKGISYWQKGLISTNGFWQDNQLTLDKLIISGVNYLLPDQWQTKITAHSLPDYLTEIKVNSLAVTPSVIVDTQAEFPMQFSDFELLGRDLLLVKQSEIGLWQGSLAARSAHATINAVTLRHADLSVSTTQPDGHLHAVFNALSASGILDAKANFIPSKQEISDLEITGYATNPEILKQWKILETPFQGNNFSLSAAGYVAPLRLHGELQTKQENKILSYKIENNKIITQFITQ